MILLLVFGVALGAPPVPCDPHAPPPLTPDTEQHYCIDQAEFVELGTLRTAARTLRAEVALLETTVDAASAREAAALDAAQARHEADMQAQRAFFDAALSEERQRSRRTFIERHGVPIGIAIGLGVALAYEFADGGVALATR